MLTSIGRAAARRVVTSSTANLSLKNTLAGRSPLALRPTAGRSFSLSRWSLMAAKTGATAGTKTATKKSASASGTKKKAAPKKKKATKAKKPAVKKKKKVAKKELTPEQQYRAKVKELKKVALVKEEPKKLATNAWSLFIAEGFSAERQNNSDLGESVRALKGRFDSLSSYEKQRLQAQASANQQANVNARKAWIESLPAEEVYAANLARKQLARLVKDKRFPKLADSRLPSRPGAPFIMWSQDQTGFSQNRTAAETFKAAAAEWRNLRDAERRTYEDKYAAQLETYQKERDALKARLAQKKKEAKAAEKAAKSS